MKSGDSRKLKEGGLKRSCMSDVVDKPLIVYDSKYKYIDSNVMPEYLEYNQISGL